MTLRALYTLRQLLAGSLPCRRFTGGDLLLLCEGSHAGLAPRCFGRVAKRAANAYTRAGPVIWDGGSGHLRRSQRVWRIRLRCCSSVVAAAISCRAVPDGPHASLPQDGVNRRNSRCRTTRETAFSAMWFRKHERLQRVITCLWPL